MAIKEKTNQPNPERSYSIYKVWKEGFLGDRTRHDITGLVKYHPYFANAFVSGDETSTRYEIKGSDIIRFNNDKANGKI